MGPKIPLCNHLSSVCDSPVLATDRQLAKKLLLVYILHRTTASERNVRSASSQRVAPARGSELVDLLFPPTVAVVRRNK